MSSQDDFQKLYQRYSPRWVKAIRWREWGQRIVAAQKRQALLFYIPLWSFLMVTPSKLQYMIMFNNPKSSEEIQLLRRRLESFSNIYWKSWGINDYNSDNDMAPFYDMMDRRYDYPEYYQGRYKIVDKTAWGEVIGSRDYVRE